jgi:hypothetical protein
LKQVITEDKISSFVSEGGLSLLSSWLQPGCDIGTVLAVFSFLEKVNMTVELLRDSKIGKALNEALKNMENPAALSKGKILLNTWKSLVSKPTPAPMPPVAPPAAPLAPPVKEQISEKTQPKIKEADYDPFATGTTSLTIAAEAVARERNGEATTKVAQGTFKFVLIGEDGRPRAIAANLQLLLPKED